MSASSENSPRSLSGDDADGSFLRRIAEGVAARSPRAIGRAITIVEEGGPQADQLLTILDEAAPASDALTLGITGTGGAGKSTLAGRLVSCFRSAGHRVGLIAVDPSSPISGGAVLGDRIRMMRHACDPDVVIRSVASRGRLGGLSAATASAARIMKAAGCHPVLIETVGVGQAEFDIVRLADLTMLVMAPGLGDDIQAMKAGLLELTDMLVVNKGDLAGADILMREMEPIAHDRGKPLLKVSAKDGSGVDDLVREVFSLFRGRAESGRLEARRQRSSDAEALDWALEMAREELSQLLENQPDELKNCSPKKRAEAALFLLKTLKAKM